MNRPTPSTLTAALFPGLRALLDEAASSLVPAPPHPLDEQWIAEQHALLCSYGIAWWLIPPEPPEPGGYL